MESALDAMTRAPLHYTPAGWTDGKEHWNSHTIRYLAFRGLVTLKADEACLSASGRVRTEPEWAA